jgi:RNA polymerase sigma factor (TIGR02999 family)
MASPPTQPPTQPPSQPDDGAPTDGDAVGADLTAGLTAGLYGELHAIARRLFASERRDHTLQPTAVVNEACLRLLTTSAPPEASRPEHVALAARILEQVLVDHHRKRSASKRGGGRLRIELEPDHVAASPATLVDFEAIHLALARLRALHERQAEIVTLRVFGGLTVARTAAALGVAKRTVEADWAVARAWLRRELARRGEGPA